MTRKLTLVFVLGLIVTVLILTYTNVVRKNKDGLDFSEFPSGEFYGSIETNEVLRVLRSVQADSLVDVFPISFSLVDGFLTTLKESGLDPSTVYLVVNSMEHTISILLKVEDSKKANEYLDEYAYMFEFQVDSSYKSPVYTYDKLSFQASEKWVAIRYIDSLLIQELNLPPVTNFPSLDPTVFLQKNSFLYASSVTDSLGIEKIMLTQKPEKNGFQWTAQVTSQQTLPYQFSKTSYNSYSFGVDSQRISFSLKGIEEGRQHPLQKKISGLFGNYGLNEEHFFEQWNGALSFELGPDIEQVDTIVTTTFDEDFNAVEEYRVRRKMKPSFLLFLGSEDPQKLIRALNKNNFFQTRNTLTRLPNGRIAHTTLTDTGVLLTTFNALSTSSIEENENIAQFTWNEFFVELQLAKSSPKEYEFLIEVFLPSQHGSKQSPTK